MIAQIEATLALLIVGGLALAIRFQDALPNLICPAAWHNTIECLVRVCGLG